MAVSRRAFAAGPAAAMMQQLLLPRRPIVVVGTSIASAASNVAARTPRRSTGRLVPPAARCRWYSVGGVGAGGSSSRIWTFDEVRQLAEQRVKRNGSSPKDEVLIVDVREPHELQATGRIPGSVNMPMTTAAQALSAPDDEFRDALGFERPPQEAHLLFYCRAGVRARTAAEMARRAGWADVGEYTGSWLEWEERGGPVDRTGGGRED